MNIQINSLTNANIYIDGVGLLGRAEEIEVANPKHKMIDYKGLGRPERLSCGREWRNSSRRSSGRRSTRIPLRCRPVHFKRIPFRRGEISSSTQARAAVRSYRLCT